MKIKKSAILALALSMSFVVTNTALAAEENPDGALETTSVSEKSIGGGKGSQELEPETSEEVTTTLEEDKEGTDDEVELEEDEEVTDDEAELETSEDEEPVAVTAVPPTNTEGTTEKDFNDAIDSKFGNVNSKEGVYEGKYDKDKKQVTVVIQNKEKSLTELGGTGLVANLTDLYKNNNLIKLQIGKQQEIDLLALGNGSKNESEFMNHIKEIVTFHLGGEIIGPTGKVKNLGQFVGKKVTLKLTVRGKDGKEIPLEYSIRGVINNKTDSNICIAPEVLEKEFSGKVDPMFGKIDKKEGVYTATYDAESKEIKVNILDETKNPKDISGTGLISGLVNLYKNNKLAKIQIGNQKERDIVEIAKASGNDQELMQNLKQILGADIANSIDSSGNNVTLGKLVGKNLPIKLTINVPDCEEEVTITYNLKGFDKDGKVPVDDNKPNPDQKPQPKPSNNDDDDFDFDFFFPDYVGAMEDPDDETTDKENETDKGKLESKENEDEKDTENKVTPKEDNKKEKDNEEGSEKDHNEENKAVRNTKKQNEAPSRSRNPKTGVASLGYLAGISAISMAGIVASRKKEGK